MNQSYAQYIGYPLPQVELAIRTAFEGRVMVLKPTDAITANFDMGRLQVWVDDQGIITRIVQG